MRDLPLLLGCLVMLLPVFRFPHVGVLLWCWTAMIVPNNFVYGFMSTVPLNKTVAGITLVVWVISREPKKIPITGTTLLLALFLLWGTISALTGVAATESAMIEWGKFWKIIVFAFVVAGLMTTKNRLDALLYSVCLSLGFHGIVEGMKYISSGGGHHVFGPPGSILGDNNHFALGMVAMLPIVYYLHHEAKTRFLKNILLGSGLIVIASIMGTTSRGGLLGAVAVGGYAWLRSNKKLKYALAALPVVIAAITFAPAKWSDRMDTIATANDDDSFMGRVIAWKQSTLIAIDNPFFGGGFSSVIDFPTWIKYSQVFHRLDFVPTSEPDPFGPHAAHSIYFQVLGDMGFAGLLIFLLILWSSWRNASSVIRDAGNQAELKWARVLATCLQYSLVAYLVSGAALSMAYFDFVYVIFAVLVVLRKIVEQPNPVGRPGMFVSKAIS